MSPSTSFLNLHGLSLSHRYSELAQGADMVREAAAEALRSGLPETAVEWLEQARSIVWGDLFHLRSTHEELLSAHSDHAIRLRELSATLDHASATHERSLSALSDQAESVSESLEKEADRHRTVAIERDKLLQEIRRLPGFERFLLQKEFSQLRASAHTGPVVILNAAESHCDALILLADVDHAIHVPLPNFTLKRSIDLQNTLNFLRDAREGRREPLGGISWESILSPLWKCVVKPVLNAIALSVRDVMLLVSKSICSSMPLNRHLATYLVSFGVRRAHLHFSSFMLRVSTTISRLQSSGTKCLTSSSRHTPLLSAFLHRRPLPIQHLVILSVSLLSVNHPQMASRSFQVSLLSWDAPRR